ncbi:MAG: hypothetical protein EHM91_06150, partial [Planctomycetota bacterium]
MVGYLRRLALIPILGVFFYKQARVRSFRRQEAEASGKAKERLELVAGELGGKIVGGPALETPRGRLEVYASRAPKSSVIDVTKYSAPVPGDLQLIVIHAEDAAKVPIKGLQPVPLADPAYQAFASDPAAAGKRFSADALARFQAVEKAARGHARLRLVHGHATVTVARGLADAAELRDFFN